jgi:hypothetical protein
MWCSRHVQRLSPEEKITHKRPVRLAYQPPASSTFLSEQISHQQQISQPTVLFSQNKPAPVISHQPKEQAEAWGGALPMECNDGVIHRPLDH